MLGPDIQQAALFGYSPDRLFFRYNTAHRPVDLQFPGPEVDIRFNALLGGIEQGDGRSNWYGTDTNNLPPCMTQAEMDAHIPRLRAKSGPHSCPSGTFPPEPVNVVLPTLSAPPGVVPASLYESAAARYGPVDTHRGALRYQITDLAVLDAGKALSATRTYRSNHTAEGDAGPGWTTANSIRCTEKKTDNACEPQEFIRVGITDGIAGALGGGAGGLVGSRITGLLARQISSPAGRALTGSAAGGMVGTVEGGAVGLGTGVLGYGLSCHPRCSMHGLAAAAWDSTRHGMLFGGVTGFAGAASLTGLPGFMNLRAPFREVGHVRAPGGPCSKTSTSCWRDQGIQSRSSGRFSNVVRGEESDASARYLWTIDRRGINIAFEHRPMPTRRGHIVHTNLSSHASMGGEVWFGRGDTATITINASSGRFGQRGGGATLDQWNAAIRAWESLGYVVKVQPFKLG